MGSHFSVSEIQNFYNSAKEGYLRALKMQEGQLKDRAFKMEMVASYRKEMEYWADQLAARHDNSLGGIRVFRSLVIDSSEESA